jgi:hypothetical protein
LIVALESRAKTDLNIEFVTIKLFHEELKKKDVEGLREARSTLVVHMSKATSNNSTTDQKVAIKRNQKKDLCNYCKKSSHWARDYKKKVAYMKKQTHT